MLSQIFSSEVEKNGNGKEKINRMAEKKTKKKCDEKTLHRI